MPTLTQEAAAEIFRNEPDHFIDVGAGEAAYRRIGTGPDVLFVHGWPVSSATFRKLLPHLVDHVTCHLIDLPSAGSSRFDSDTPLSIEQHITSVRRIVDHLQAEQGIDDIAVVGHDSGGLIARHAMAGDPRLRALGLIDTETPSLGLRFKSFIALRHLPGLGAGLNWLASHERLCRSRLVFGDIFADRSNFESGFNEFGLRPLATSQERSWAAGKILASFDMDHINDLPAIHQQITAPVQLVWGAKDKFFPVARARAMVHSFPDAALTEIADAGLLSHEEQPQQVATALLPTLRGKR